MLQIIDLPDDILRSVVVATSQNALVQLSSTCKAFRTRLSPFAFNNAKCTWNQLLDQDDTITNIIPYIHHIRLVDAYPYGEWHIDLIQCLQRFKNLNSLSINLPNSANWLKYRQDNRLKQLRLYSDIRNDGRVFEIGHVRHFTALSTLTLVNYHFLSALSENHAIINHLKLTDCTWEYPFSLSLFNTYGNLRSLSLTYHRNHPFVLLERFARFLDFSTELPMLHLESLSIVLENNHKSWRRVLSPKQLSVFILPFNYPALRDLRLYGWLISRSEASQLGNLLKDISLQKLILQLYTFENGVHLIDHGKSPWLTVYCNITKV